MAMEKAFGLETYSWISVGDPIKLYQRDIYPVARISSLKGHRSALGCLVLPLALLIAEPTQSYVVSLTGEEMTLDQLLAIAPSLKYALKKDYSAYR